MRQTWQVIQGDVRDGLRSMPEQSAHVCVTSPPYWGLRDYGTASWDGGDAACDHTAPPSGGRIKGSTLAGTGNRDGFSADGQYRDTCRKCGARRVDRQIGLEQTPERYVAQLVEVFREVRRVLRDDGTMWVNLGDSYSSNVGGVGNNPSGKSTLTTNNGAGPRRGDKYAQGNEGTPVRIFPGTKPKDLIGIPWRVAFALQADGWYLRSDIIWAKMNPMPESVTDRPTKGHEYLFLLAKKPKYYYDAAAIAEEAINAGKVVTNNNGKNGQMGEYGATRGGFMQPEGVTVGDTRNRRTVWTIATQPFSEAHFAVFPEALVEPCIKAGSPVGGVVLDPFSGSGTTGVVALKQGRSYVGCELNPEYVQMSRRRLGDVAPLLAREVA